jgi:chaperonin GroEL (HSP60 family)
VSGDVVDNLVRAIENLAEAIENQPRTIARNRALNDARNRLAEVKRVYSILCDAPLISPEVGHA